MGVERGGADDSLVRRGAGLEAPSVAAAHLLVLGHCSNLYR